MDIKHTHEYIYNVFTAKMSHGDAHIIRGMEAIVNPDNIKPGIDLKELERQMVSGGIIEHKIKDPSDRFNDELKDAANKLGITFGETEDTKPQQSGFDDFLVNDNGTGGDRDPWAGGDSHSPSGYSPDRRSPTHRSPERQSYGGNRYDGGNGGNGDYDGDYDGDYNGNINGNINGNDGNGGNDDGDDGDDEYGDSYNTFARSVGGDLSSRTHEQERHKHIDSVMGDQPVGFSFEKEKREDIKCAMLAEVDSLMSSLVDEDIDVTRIPKVDRESSFAEVESVLKIMRHKNDHTRYCSFAEEFLLFGAYSFEDLFDGKRKWFGRYSPDLTGWHNHVNVKLKRMRHDTGQIVSGVMQDYNIGPGLRVMLELIPNMVLYSKMRKQQHNQPGIFSDDEMSQAAHNLRNTL